MTIEKQLKKLSKGNTAAFDYIYSQTRERVFYIALSIVKDRSVAEDVMQSAYLSIIRHAGSFKPGTNANAWISRIVRNEALNVKKKRDREFSVDERENPAMFGVQHTDDYGLLIDLARNVLTEEEFRVLMLVACDGYKRREIAEMLEMPVSTVTYKLGCAVKKMRDELKRS